MDKLSSLIIAAYLHDIGKLAVRAKDYVKDKNFDIHHAQVVREIIEKLGLPDFWLEVADIAAHHHQSDLIALLDSQASEEEKFLAWCVYMADNISAGERSKKEDKSQNKESWEHLGFPLGRIFQVFNFGLVDLRESKQIGWEVSTLTDFRGDFVHGQDQYLNYQDLWFKFWADLSKLILQYPGGIPEDQFQSFVYKLDLLLQNYLTLVPSDTYQSDIADISLYDHSKTVVVFAQILYEAFKDFENKSELYRLSTDKVIELLKNQNFKVPLIAGDFAGIQRYIADGIKKTDKASKRLRARSLIVQLLSETVLHYILKKFNLPPANVLINAGGKFVVVERGLKSGEEEVGRDIEKIKAEVNEFLIREFPGVKVVLVARNYDVEQIAGREQGNNFKYVLEDLFEKLGESKFKVYNEDNLKQIFKQESVSGKILCKYCGLHYVEASQETADVRCTWCENEIDLGEKIVKDLKQGIFVDFEKDGKFVFDYKVEPSEKGALKIQFNNWDLDVDELKTDYLTVGKSVNLYVPDDGKGNVKSFEELLDETNSDYLVMLKGDVDNMSLVLKYGLPDRFYTLSRILTFSRFLELYFGKVLNDWLANEWENVYTVFSGGDDFVFVMPFFVKELEKKESRESEDNKQIMDIVDLVKAFYEKWGGFVGNNPFLHFSTGLGIFKSKTPLKFVYEGSESILSEAKKVVKDKYEKLQEDESSVVQLLRQFAVAGFDKGHFVICSLEGNFDEILRRFDELKECELEKFVKSEIKSGVLYKSYQVLKEIYQELNKDKSIDWAKVVLDLSKLSYMLVRNLDFRNDDSRAEFKKWFADKFGRLENKDEFKRRIAKMLFKLAYRIYKQRQKKLG